MTHPLSLDAVQAEFQQWRQQRAYPRSAVPEDLRQKALALRADFSLSKITKALGITYDMLRAWGGQDNKKISKAGHSAALDFISLPTTELETSVAIDSVQLRCELPNGHRWCLQGAFSPELLTAFIRSVQAVARGDR